MTFDLCVWNIKSLTLSADIREELKSTREEIALNGGPCWDTAQVCAGAYALAPIRRQWASPLGSTGRNLGCLLVVDAAGIRIVSAAKSCHSESHRSAWTLPLGSAWLHS